MSAWPGPEFEHSSDSWIPIAPDSSKQQGVKSGPSISFLLVPEDRCLQCVECYYPPQPRQVPVVGSSRREAGVGGSILVDREKWMGQGGGPAC